ncbi:unnamed protein product [Ceratitis capitata]|uniref:(Mediterranean fruit fly) hypothetical protein n=1 Tax=Ceratitis capitata TaxID=7213 RepID=A0A811V2D2_CERCA|nr:unnamed protein product [Ceratitis capitata]
MEKYLRGVSREPVAHKMEVLKALGYELVTNPREEKHADSACSNHHYKCLASSRLKRHVFELLPAPGSVGGPALILKSLKSSTNCKVSSSLLKLLMPEKKRQCSLQSSKPPPSYSGF